MYWGRYRRVPAGTEDEEGIFWEGSELSQGLGNLILKDWRCLLRDLLNDCEGQQEATSFLKGVVTILKRDVDAIEVQVLREVILRNMRDNTARRVTNESWCWYTLALGKGKTAEARCECARCLENCKLEHLWRQLV